MRKRSSFGQAVTFSVVLLLLTIIFSESTTMARTAPVNPHDVKVIRLSSTPTPGIKPNNPDKTANNQDTLHSQRARQIPKASFLRKFGSALLILLAIITLGALFRRWKAFFRA
jgi:hypothetical protein